MKAGADTGLAVGRGAKDYTAREVNFFGKKMERSLFIVIHKLIKITYDVY